LQGQGLLLKAKAKALTFKAKAKDSKFVLEDTPRTKAKDNNTGRQAPDTATETLDPQRQT